MDEVLLPGVYPADRGKQMLCMRCVESLGTGHEADLYVPCKDHAAWEKSPRHDELVLIPTMVTLWRGVLLMEVSSSTPHHAVGVDKP